MPITQAPAGMTAQQYLQGLLIKRKQAVQLERERIDTIRYVARPTLARGPTNPTQLMVPITNAGWRQLIPGDRTRRVFWVVPLDDDAYIWPLKQTTVVNGGLLAKEVTQTRIDDDHWGMFAQLEWFVLGATQPAATCGLIIEQYTS